MAKWAIRAIDALLAAVGGFAALLVLGIIALIVLEMFSRTVLGISLAWAHEASTWLLTAFVFLGGPYALIRGRFVRVDVIHARMSPRAKAIVDTTFSTVLMLALVITLFWLGGRFFLSSWAVGETSASGSWAGPVWLTKAMMPIGAALLVLAWMGHLLKLWSDEPQASSASEMHSESAPLEGSKERD